MIVAVALLAGGVRAEEPIGLSVLSYNTHGLAGWIVDDEPAIRFPQISRLLNGYDVALIQEDWSWHEELVAAAEHPVIEMGNGSRFWIADFIPIFGGSGLTSFVRAAREDVLEVTREAYGSCSGWLGGANDCLGSKGFLRVRLRLAPGAELDVYQTHLDAGDAAGDEAARGEQLAQLRRRIAQLSGDGALILAGDFNLHSERPAQRAILDEFVASLGLLDSGAAPVDPAQWERLDYIFYRSGGGVRLEVVSAGQALEFQHQGRPLSDHPALFSRFRLR